MITGKLLRDAIISGANNILKNRKYVDSLNIFPVPDGDTGTNMSMTISAGSDAMQKLGDEVTTAETAKAAASAMLRGARGNSGVILSLLFRGFSKGLEDTVEADGAQLAQALTIGVEAAYKAVMKPTEGTILTVARVGAEKGTAAAEIDNDPIYVWDAICLGAAEALATTPDLLPVLKKAGVVDAGGQGLCMILDGMMSVFKNGEIIQTGMTEEERAADNAEFFASVAAEFDSEITFTYCTEFIVGRDPEVKTEPNELRMFLETIGDCVVVVDDEEIIKVHVHTEQPGDALTKALTFGSLLTVKIENMREQHRKAAEQNEAERAAFEAKNAEAEKPALEPVEPEEEIGFVAVAAGEGLHALFGDLGCAQIVSGGQTMNPSTEDIVAAALATPAKHVLVLPNNKNIIMAAEQAIPLVTDRQIHVIPTRTVPQGLSAMLAFDPDSDADTNAEAMLAAAQGVQTGNVTFAARDSEFGGFKIKEGDIMGLVNGKLEFVGEAPVRIAYKTAKAMLSRSTSFITVIYGEGVSEDDANEVVRLIRNKAGDDVEISVVNGGQPVYHFIISVE
ncbi:MAG: DAK2 domain-containing protein [Clostridia bacterium]|nr:DAK2 domain-containing protein [Clostridia bacterium]